MVFAFEEAQRFVERGRSAERTGAADEALGWYERALVTLTRHEPTPVLADVLRWKGTVHRECGDISEADRLYRQSVEIAATAGYAAGIAHALNCRGAAAQIRGDLDAAEELYREAQQRAMDADDLRLSAMARRNLGIIAGIRGDTEVALGAFKDSLAAAEQLDDEDGQCRALINIGMTYLHRSRFTDAASAFTKSMELASARGDRVIECICRLNRAEAYVGGGHIDDGEADALLALVIADRRGDRLRRADGLKILGTIARLRLRFAEAESALREAFDLTDAGEDALLAGELRREMAELYRARDEAATARQYYYEAKELFSQSGARRSVVAIDELLATLSVTSVTARDGPPLQT